MPGIGFKYLHDFVIKTIHMLLELAIGEAMERIALAADKETTVAQDATPLEAA